MDDKASLTEFVRIGEVAETTTQLLSLNLQYGTSLGAKHTERPAKGDSVELYVLQQARTLLAQVREGFVLSVRRVEIPDQAEIRYLLDRVLLDWTSLSREFGLATDDELQQLPEQESQLERLRYQLLAFSMATTALGFLPHTPVEEVTFPYNFHKPPTYGDIPVPTTPGEMLHRLEEIEKTVWKLMAMDLQELVNHHLGPLRRTYGFFEVSALLARREMVRFGVKRPRS